MKIGGTITGDISGLTRRLSDGLADNLRQAVDRASAALQAELRSQVTAAGLGPRVAQAWRRQTYPAPGTKSLSPAALVWSKAGTIVRAYNEGTPIRPKRGAALAIPSDWVPLKANRRRMTPVEVEARFNRDLRYVKLPNGNAVLIMDQVIEGRSGGLRRASKGRKAQGRRVTSKIMFTLVRQVKVAKRLDVERAAAGAESALASALRGLSVG